MKVTKAYLRQVIKEEFKKVLKEGTDLPMSYLEVGTDYDPETGAEITKFDDLQIKGKARDKNVVKLQRFLISKGALPKGADDGIVGPKTTEAYNLVFKPKKPLTPEILASLVKKAPQNFDASIAAYELGQKKDGIGDVELAAKRGSTKSDFQKSLSGLKKPSDELRNTFDRLK